MLSIINLLIIIEVASTHLVLHATGGGRLGEQELASALKLQGSPVERVYVTISMKQAYLGLCGWIFSHESCF